MPCGDSTLDVPFPPLLPPHIVSKLLSGGRSRPIAKRTTYKGLTHIHCNAALTPLVCFVCALCSLAGSIEMFFAGKVPNHLEVDKLSDKRLSHEPYAEVPGSGVEATTESAEQHTIVLSSKTYLRDYTLEDLPQGKICLAALGQGWGIRLIWSLAAGCIPLLPTSEVQYTFGGALNYSKFAFPNVQSRSLGQPGYLKGLVGGGGGGEKRLSDLQESLYKHLPLFLYPPHGIAHRMVLRLCVRAPRMQHVGREGSGRRAECDRLIGSTSAFPALFSRLPRGLEII